MINYARANPRKRALINDDNGGFHTEPNSFRIVATVATHGVYKSTNVKNDKNAGIEVNNAVIPPLPASISIVLTTASFAVNPAMSAETILPSFIPSGLNTGARKLPICSNKLTLSSTPSVMKIMRLLYACKNHTTSVARKMTVNARVRKSFDFSHIRRSTLLRTADDNSEVP